MEKTEEIGGLRWKTVAMVKLEGKKELAEEVLRTINICHFGASIDDDETTLRQRYNALRNSLRDICEEVLAE